MNIHETETDGVVYVTFSDPRWAGTADGGAQGYRVQARHLFTGWKATGAVYDVCQLIERGGAIVSTHNTKAEALDTARKLRDDMLSAAA